MNQLCSVCVDLLVHDERQEFDVVNMHGVHEGPAGGHAANMAMRAQVVTIFAMTDAPERTGFFRSRSTGYELYMFAVTVIGAEPRCAMHCRSEGDRSWHRR